MIPKSSGLINCQLTVIIPFTKITVNGKTLLNKKLPLKSTVEIEDEAFANVHLWDDHDPYLYQLIIEVHDQDGKLVELIPYQFGFRKIEITKDHVVLLNGKRLIINGINRHEWDAKRGRSITLADIKEDIATFKHNNINAVRTCHYPNQILWYYLCYQNGIYMMAENNLESHGTWQKLAKLKLLPMYPAASPNGVKSSSTVPAAIMKPSRITLQSYSGNLATNHVPAATSPL